MKRRIHSLTLSPPRPPHTFLLHLVPLCEVEIGCYLIEDIMDDQSVGKKSRV